MDEGDFLICCNIFFLLWNDTGADIVRWVPHLASLILLCRHLGGHVQVPQSRHHQLDKIKSFLSLTLSRMSDAQNDFNSIEKNEKKLIIYIHIECAKNSNNNDLNWKSEQSLFLIF